MAILPTFNAAPQDITGIPTGIHLLERPDFLTFPFQYVMWFLHRRDLSSSVGSVMRWSFSKKGKFGRLQALTGQHKVGRVVPGRGHGTTQPAPSPRTLENRKHHQIRSLDSSLILSHDRRHVYRALRGRTAGCMGGGCIQTTTNIHSARFMLAMGINRWVSHPETSQMVSVPK